MTSKRLDCVRMKGDIQSRLAGEIARMTVEERRDRLEDALKNDRSLRAIWHRAGRRMKKAS